MSRTLGNDVCNGTTQRKCQALDSSRGDLRQTPCSMADVLTACVVQRKLVADQILCQHDAILVRL